MPSRLRKSFISYDRDDSLITDRISDILRAVGAHVFLDVDSLEPGEIWEDELQESLDDSDVVFVFWSRNTPESTYVKKEYLRAIEHKKKIIPVLLDSTPLPPKLAQYGWIDCRDIFLLQQGRVSVTGWIVSFVAGAAVAGIGTAYALGRKGEAPRSPPPTEERLEDHPYSTAVIVPRHGATSLSEPHEGPRGWDEEAQDLYPTMELGEASQLPPPDFEIELSELGRPIPDPEYYMRVYEELMAPKTALPHKDQSFKDHVSYSWIPVVALATVLAWVLARMIWRGCSIAQTRRAFTKALATN